ncbi:hypothetical protein AX16_000245 [Volvariella volvacea WC 439]|nr:hypothetical protein AX16_000245 [Volvariella volvacea WC 439]
MCYQDSRGHEGPDSVVRGDDHHYSRVDPAQEISRIRHSLSLIETYLFPHQRHHAPASRRGSEAANPVTKKEAIDPDVNEKSTAAPGMLGTQGQGGLYSGPTSAATHLLINDGRNSEESETRQQSQERTEDPPNRNDYDSDLLQMLPGIEVIDALVTYYFEYCNWIYKHINQPSFTHHWQRYKSGNSADRITLATACVIMAVATHYLPPNHHLLESFNETAAERGAKFYEIGVIALQRRLEETKAYTLELVELQLLRTHYLNMSKTDSEDVWRLRGEVVSIALAIGLHRDPGKWGMHRDLAERRRWAWWHIILLERWQAFMFGRPLVIASHHFDTQLPSYCDPAIDKTGRLFLPNIALFRLAFILGDIMDDAVSVRAVPYESVQANDRALTQWMDNLPPELDLDEYRVARSLASPNASQRRLGVQSMIIRTSYYHIRFTLHRPYASANNQTSSPSSKTTSLDSSKTAQSLEIAVSAADKLIQMTSSDFIGNASLTVPGHMNWGPFHCFSAAMFFSFQLIANPDQPGANLFRSCIRKAMATIEASRGTPVSDKAYDILQALAPLYSAEFPMLSLEARKKQQAQVLGVVRKLAFPYSDRKHSGEAAHHRSANSPATSSSVSPPITSMASLPPGSYDGLAAHNMSTNHQAQIPSMAGMISNQVSSPSSATAAYGSIGIGGQQPAAGYTMTSQQQLQQHQVIYTDPGIRYAHYAQPVDEATMWGAAIGFNHGEWNQFLDGMRPDVSQIQVQSRHLAPPTS